MAKAAKKAVNYRKAASPARRCANCLSMNSDGTCTKVAGQVSPTYVCDRWTGEKKTGNGTRR